MKTITLGDIVFNPTNRTITCVTAGDKPYQTKLSDAEKNILEYLLENPNKYISKEDLISIGWGKRPIGSNSLPVAIANIRKIKNNDAFLIENLTKVGYILTIKNNLEICIHNSLDISSIDEDTSMAFSQENTKEEITISTSIDNKSNGKKLNIFRLGYMMIASSSCILGLGVLIYIYIGWIDISCENSNINALSCFTDIPPDNVEPFIGGGVEIIAKSGIIEDRLIIRDPKK
ncbi:winged helix-turn-helix domain-containing protein [Aeromonas veronii]|uniref:winged helix-turn-helix domain-containing protein n=1 Tax=Aeromonas veronii TaxID=654 RepID=UPI00405571E5